MDPYRNKMRDFKARFLEPATPKDAISSLAMLALSLFAAGALFGMIGAQKESTAGATGGGFAIAGGLVILAAAWVHGASQGDQNRRY